MAASVRQRGIDAFEFDLSQQGGMRNILHASTLHELKAPIAQPMCRGIWFGHPCGAFSSARRNDGGPTALRGTNSKDIWGLLDLQCMDRARWNTANKLLLRMHGLTKLCESSDVPFDIENPQSSKLWMHPIIKKWVRHKSLHLVQLDYCQLARSGRSQPAFSRLATPTSTPASPCAAKHHGVREFPIVENLGNFKPHYLPSYMVEQKGSTGSTKPARTPMSSVSTSPNSCTSRQ